jgi:hypothetical protein
MTISDRIKALLYGRPLDVEVPVPEGEFVAPEPWQLTKTASPDPRIRYHDDLGRTEATDEAMADRIERALFTHGFTLASPTSLRSIILGAMRETS